MAVGGSRQHILNSRFYSPWEMFCFGSDQSIVNFQPRLMLRVDILLQSKINRIIQNAFESGLFSKWERDSQRKKERIFPIEPPLTLNLEQYSFALVTIYGSGVIISTLALCFEFVIRWNMIRSHQWRIWMYLQQFFDGQRHYFKDSVKILIESREQNDSQQNVILSNDEPNDLE